MIVPGSERATHYWLQNTTALGELMGYDFSFLSLDRLYKASDHLMKHKQAIEDHLCEAETRLFVLEEKIILYPASITAKLNTGSQKKDAVIVLWLHWALSWTCMVSPKRVVFLRGTSASPERWKR
jgi:hypothetical protein